MSPTIVRVVQDDGDKGLKLIIKLNAEHIRLATQVLSESVGKHLNLYQGPEYHQQIYAWWWTQFFDLLNIKNDIEHTTSIKEFFAPFTSLNDKRFKWLINDFLPYLERWQEIAGNFTTADKKKMFLSHQTYTGILINVHSIIEMVLGMAQITIIVTMTMIIFKNLYWQDEWVKIQQRRILDVLGLLGGVMNIRHCINSVMTQIWLECQEV